MARSGKKARNKRRKGKRAGFFKRVALTARVIGWVAVLFFFGSIVWAATLRFTPPAGTLLMVERSLQGQTVRREWTQLNDISPYLVRAVIAGEDTQFCRHHGVDLEAIDEALEESKNGRRLRGASTISQQTAKNVFLWNGRSWLRKGGEAWFTLLIETLWPKRRIMEVYLNVAEWGDGLFGAEVAAQARFGVSAKNLTPYQAALLASVLPNPKKWRVDPPGPYVRRRARTLRGRMEQVRRDGLAACVL